jgi:hypothetical protein
MLKGNKLVPGRCMVGVASRRPLSTNVDNFVERWG